MLNHIELVCYHITSETETHFQRTTAGQNHNAITYNLMKLKLLFLCRVMQNETREGFLRKNIVAVSFFQNCAIHQYS